MTKRVRASSDSHLLLDCLQISSRATPLRKCIEKVSTDTSRVLAALSTDLRLQHHFGRFRKKSEPPSTRIFLASATVFLLLDAGMVVVTVQFWAEGQRWQRDFEIEADATIRALKESMLNPHGGEEDIDAFELRMRGRRVPDFEKVSQDCTLDFEYLGASEGARKARLDRQDEARWDVLQLPQQEPPERIRPRSVPAAKKSDSSIARSETSDEFFRPTPAPRPAGAARKGPPAPVKRWEVVGGSDKGGILVREGQSTTSKQLADRLSTGALVEELDLRGERLQFKRLTGTGPETGWVSLSVSGKELVRPKQTSPQEMLTLDCALSLQEELMEGFGKPEFQRTLAQLVRAHPTKAGAEFLRKRTELFLSVQSVVLPRYGFEGSPKGVVQMMAAYAPHGHCPEVGWNNDQLNKLLQM
ncbi:unnamed protein product [Symbiodinium sp. CCMP2592]|nr:unnamed protein product [Symbiodinium sp. CCMP2592]